MKERFIKTLKYISKISLVKLIAFVVAIFVMFSMTTLLHLADINSAMVYYAQVNNASVSMLNGANAELLDFAALFNQTGSVVAPSASTLTTASNTIANSTGIVSTARPDLFTLLFTNNASAINNSEQLKQFFIDAKAFNTNLNNFFQQRVNSFNKLCEYSLVLSLSIYVSIKIYSYLRKSAEEDTEKTKNEYVLTTPTNKYTGHFSKSVFLTTCHLTC